MVKFEYLKENNDAGIIILQIVKCYASILVQQVGNRFQIKILVVTNHIMQEDHNEKLL
jgi:hypothetical protein